MRPTPLLRFAFAFAFTFAFAAPIAAQNATVVPSKYAGVEANAFTQWPLGSTTPCRYQQIYGSSAVALPAVLVKRISTRPDGGNGTSPAKLGVDMDITLSSSPADPFRPSPTFAANHGANVTVVFARKLVNLPAIPATPMPAPFLTAFPLDTSFLYVRASGSLVVDWVIHSATPGGYSHDTSLSFPPVVTQVGAGCGGLTQTVVDGAAFLPSSVLTFEVVGGVPNGLGLHLLGRGKLASPLPLPIGTCSLHQDVVASFPLPISAIGTGKISYPLLFEHVGATVYGQALVADTALTLLLSSQSHAVTIGGYDAQSRVYDLRSDTATYGQLQYGIGLVMELGY